MNNITHIANENDENNENILIYMTCMYIFLCSVSIYKYYKLIIRETINSCKYY